MRVQTGIEGVTVESVETLYAERERMDVPAYYENGGVNPYDGRCRVVPRKARHYAMVLERDTERLALARALLRGVGKRRKVREKVCSKVEVNFNQFAKGGDVVVLFV